MYRVLVTDNLSPAGLKLLEDNPDIELDIRSGLSPEEVKDALKTADGIIIRSGTKLTPELLDGQSRLRAVVRAGVGVDNIDLPAATREGVVVMNTPAGNTISTAEHTVAMMMALSRNIGPAAASMSEGKWERKKFTGTQLAGKTLAVVGLGRIGQSVATRAQGLEMNIVGYDPFLSVERAKEMGITLYRNVDELIPLCDYLTVHTPLNDETRSLINAERMQKMKPGVRIINCARGGIVDEDALADAIESGHVAGAALDVFVSEPPTDSRLPQLPQVLCTPHLGASTAEAQELVALEAAEIMAAFLVRNEVRHAINMAPVSAKEMEDIQLYLDLGHRLGLLLAQQSRDAGIREAHIDYRGEVASKKTKMITASFAMGLLSNALGDSVNIVNSEMMARDRGIAIIESSSAESRDFSTMVSVTLTTDDGEHRCAGTIFGNGFLRLVRLDQFHLEAFLDGILLIYRHRDVPGLIGVIGKVMGDHQVNIADMALGRVLNEPGGDSVAVLHLDSEPSDAALEEIAQHPEVTSVEVIKLPKAGAPLPWMVSN